MTVTTLETLELRNVVVRTGERAELCFGITGQVTEQAGENPSQSHPSLNPWNSANPSASLPSAYMPDAMPDADGQWPGTGRSLGQGRTFGSTSRTGLQPTAGEQTAFRQTPLKATQLTPSGTATRRGKRRTEHRRTGNTSVGG